MGERHVLAAVERELARRLHRGEPVWWLKVHGHGMQRRGEPDLIICYGGRLVVAEVKSDTGRLSPLQSHRLEQWRQAGAVAGVIRSVQELGSLLGEGGPSTS